MRKLVRVTADDIAKGCPRSSEDCPVALALKRSLGWEGVIAGRQYLHYRTPKGMASTPTPPKVSAFMQDFDSRFYGVVNPVEPFNFYVEVGK